MSRCKEDDMAVTWEEIVKAGESDKEYSAVKKAVLEGFPEKLEDCIPLIQAFHKNRHNLSVVVEDKLEVVVYHNSDLRTRMLIPKFLQEQGEADPSRGPLAGLDQGQEEGTGACVLAQHGSQVEDVH